jgi:hypothetical protein
MILAFYLSNQVYLMKLLRSFIVAVLVFAAHHSHAALPSGLRMPDFGRSQYAKDSPATTNQHSGWSIFRRIFDHQLNRMAKAHASRGGRYSRPRIHVHNNSLLGIGSMLCSGLGTWAALIALDGLFWGGIAVLPIPFLIAGICFAAGIVLAIYGIRHDRHRGFARAGLVLNIIGGVPWFCLLFPAIGIGGF